MFISVWEAENSVSPCILPTGVVKMLRQYHIVIEQCNLVMDIDFLIIFYCRDSTHFYLWGVKRLSSNVKSEKVKDKICLEEEHDINTV